MEAENIIMQYISVWGWHILGIIFLVNAFVVTSSAGNLMGDVFMIAFLIGFLLCEVIALKRRAALKIDEYFEENEQER